MKPSRPDSAKSARTKITVDSEISSRDLNFSKFSETYSNGVSQNNQKKNDFHKYVSQKNKQQKYRRLAQADLPEIPEKPNQSEELSKLTSKPFERKPTQNKQQKKVEEAPIKETNTNQAKKSTLKNGKSFVERNKQKLNSLKIGTSKQVQKQQPTTQSKLTQPKPTTQSKPKISFDGFTVKEPGKPVKKIKENDQKQVQKEQKKAEESKQEERRKQLLELSHFIEDMQMRNVDVYPNQYEQFLRKNQANNSIDKININDYIDQPNEKDYNEMMKKIKNNEKMLEESGGQDSLRSSQYSSKSSSINLDAVIDGNQEQGNSQNDDPDNRSVALSSMTAEEVRERNMFLTEILKRRITESDIEEVKDNDETHMKLIKLDPQKKEEDFSDDEIEMTKINMSKKKTSKIMLRNKIEATGDIYRQCDFLSPEQQQRIQQLIGDTEIQSPFIPNQMERFMERRVDQGIHLHRQLTKTEDDEQIETAVINEEVLPKDPMLKKEAELKMLKQKMTSVNNRLKNVDNAVVNKSKIDGLITKFKERTKISRDGEALVEQKRKEIEEQQRKLELASELIEKIQGEKGQINGILEELNNEYIRANQEIQRMKKMDEQELRQLQLAELAKKKQSANDIQRQIQSFEREIQDFEAIGQQLQYNLNQLGQIIHIELPEIQCQNYTENQTINDLDRIITLKWERVQEAREQSNQQ